MMPSSASCCSEGWKGVSWWGTADTLGFTRAKEHTKSSKTSRQGEEHILCFVSVLCASLAIKYYNVHYQQIEQSISEILKSVCVNLSNLFLYFSLAKGNSPHSAPIFISGPQWATPGGSLWRRRALPCPPWQRPCLSRNCLHTHTSCCQYLHSFWDVLQVRSPQSAVEWVKWSDIKSECTNLISSVQCDY